MIPREFCSHKPLPPPSGLCIDSGFVHTAPSQSLRSHPGPNFQLYFGDLLTLFFLLLRGFDKTPLSCLLSSFLLVFGVDTLFGPRYHLLHEELKEVSFVTVFEYQFDEYGNSFCN